MSRMLRTFREMMGLLSRGDFDRHVNQLMTEAIDARLMKTAACPACASRKIAVHSPRKPEGKS